MKNTLSNVLIFAVGAAIGSAATWYFVKTKYERIAQKEIDSVKEEFTKHTYVGPQNSDEAASMENDISEEDTVEVFVDGTVKEEYSGMVKKLGYHNYSDVEPTHIQKSQNNIFEDEDGPRIISPDDFGTKDYRIVELTYWADGVVTDTKNKRIKDVDGLLGHTLERFGEYEPDALHVRNDAKKIDFEILRDLKNYGDFFDDDSPQQAEEE